ncbi:MULTISPECIES: cyanophycinase [unclassified Tolypothrix]|uniref:cyanophycinase n=1 Tax=unclassified Tolypothrix TaxID=2649714 RepID=UPI0005EABDFD|nr:MULTISPECIES: cyanophycinase [unclassified Tolypothrix]BAY89896.1 cyanophycinase [Microchaete diplosiphon NIES-3275]EKE96933.1 cyanophycinase [Tolypothrix sp. PCC 7601]MBE9082162.1 cyanophycinase [Tolypothrix sp. LEGE 11397]UYD24133.1 cyanophycinase [Tolypothrix sp. PCC 7712]UYD33635.1 cyanophycinase [Tolypothrix sp. PCC 7601]
MVTTDIKRQLVIIGGAEDKEGDCQILREFLRRAGGTKAHIVIMTAATELPREVGENYIRVFERLGAEKVRIVDTETREDASSSTALQAINDATGIFFTGGDQARITGILKDTEIDKAIHNRLAEGVVIAGTSAGAAVMPDKMIVEGDSETNPRIEIVDMGPGMGFLPGVVIDQHFSQRGRLGRLISALLQEPADLGFGIDENTAMVVTDHQIEVIGEGAVTIVDESEATHNNIDEILKDEPLAIFGAKLHILPHGYKFDIKTRQPILQNASIADASVPVGSANS